MSEWMALRLLNRKWGSSCWRSTLISISRASRCAWASAAAAACRLCCASRVSCTSADSTNTNTCSPTSNTQAAGESVTSPVLPHSSPSAFHRAAAALTPRASRPAATTRRSSVLGQRAGRSGKLRHTAYRASAASPISSDSGSQKASGPIHPAAPIDTWAQAKAPPASSQASR